jgi:hypothetical protein
VTEKPRKGAPLTFPDLADAKHSVDIGSLNSAEIGAHFRLPLPQRWVLQFALR